jgi:hypothetical protein
MPLVLRHPDVGLQLVGEGGARLFLDLRVEYPVDAAIVALLAVEIAVHGLGEQGIDDIVFLLLRDQDVDIELGPESGDALNEFQRGHLELFSSIAFFQSRKRVKLVIHQHRLDVAVILDRGERFARRGHAAEGDSERVVERAGGRVQALDDLAQRERFVFNDQDSAEGF